MYRLNPAIYSGNSGGKAILSLSPVAWYRYGQGITVATGVSQWNDQSGNNSHLTQATGTNQPGLQGDGSILFNGTAHFMRTPSISINQPGTVYALARQVTWVAAVKLLDGVAAGGRWVIQQKSGGASPQLEIFAGAAVAANSDLALNTYGVICAQFNGASSSLQINNNAAATGDAGANNITGGFTVCGDNASTPTTFGNFQIKEVIIFPAAHDSATRAKVTRYLSAVGQLGL